MPQNNPCSTWFEKITFEYQTCKTTRVSNAENRKWNTPETVLGLYIHRVAYPLLFSSEQITATDAARLSDSDPVSPGEKEGMEILCRIHSV